MSPARAIATLVSGIVLALGTSWGLFRHYWVVFSLIITVIATAVLLGHMADVRELAAQAADPDADISQFSGDLAHSIGGLLRLLAPLVFNIYKPRGLTHYGQRKQHAQPRPSTSITSSEAVAPQPKTRKASTSERSDPGTAGKAEPL